MDACVVIPFRDTYPVAARRHEESLQRLVVLGLQLFENLIAKYPY